MQQEPLQDQVKDPQAVVNGQRGGRLRMAQLSPRERSELGRHAAFAKHHPYQFKQQQERAEELARVVKQAIGDYLPSEKRDMMQR
jgi:hypothetical protein